MAARPPRPVIENATGLTWRYLKGGWEGRWRARPDLIAKGFGTKSVTLWAGPVAPTEAQGRIIADQCRKLQVQMLSHGRELMTFGPFNGSLAGLIEVYKTDKVSPYPKKRFATRQLYDRQMARIKRDHGDVMLADIKARTIHAWHAEWLADGKITTAHGLVGMLRTLFGFGLAFLEDESGQDQCERLSVVLSKARFEVGKPRNERITSDQANAVRAMAWQMGRPSVALAQAFQFECTLRQKDVIGEWVPVGEPGFSTVPNGNDKWLRGLDWKEIDQGFTLKHVTSKRNKLVEVPLLSCPMVVEELCRRAGVASVGELRRDMFPATGPVIICEYDDIPWTAHEFRRWWRKVADACGIPRTVFNMDSRAGAITEATEAGAPMEHVRHAATHGNIAMTEKYSRGSAEKIANVLRIRTEHRNKSGTK